VGRSYGELLEKDVGRPEEPSRVLPMNDLRRGRGDKSMRKKPLTKNTGPGKTFQFVRNLPKKSRSFYGQERWWDSKRLGIWRESETLPPWGGVPRVKCK